MDQRCGGEIEGMASDFFRKADEIFPPETRAEQIKHGLPVAKPYIIPAVVLLILIPAVVLLIPAVVLLILIPAVVLLILIPAVVLLIPAVVLLILIPAVVLLILIRFCLEFLRILVCFWRGFLRIPIRFCRGFLCGGGTVVKKGPVKMMIAPVTGRAFKIPRPSFEAAPRSYFRGLRGKADEVFPPETRADKIKDWGQVGVIGAKEWISYAVEKSKEWLVVLNNFGVMFIAKADEVFPPETRAEQIKHWLQVAKRYIVIPAVLLILISCCPGFVQILICFCPGFPRILVRFCRGFLWIPIRFCISFLCGGGTVVKKGVKMMIAPGTKGASKIARASFEADPRLYFHDLRGK